MNERHPAGLAMKQFPLLEKFFLFFINTLKESSED